MDAMQNICLFKSELVIILHKLILSQLHLFRNSCNKIFTIFKVGIFMQNWIQTVFCNHDFYSIHVTEQFSCTFFEILGTYTGDYR